MVADPLNLSTQRGGARIFEGNYKGNTKIVDPIKCTISDYYAERYIACIATKVKIK